MFFFFFLMKNNISRGRFLGPSARERVVWSVYERDLECIINARSAAQWPMERGGGRPLLGTIEEQFSPVHTAAAVSIYTRL